MRAAQAASKTFVRTWANFVGCTRCLQPERGQFNDAAFEATTSYEPFLVDPTRCRTGLMPTRPSS